MRRGLATSASANVTLEGFELDLLWIKPVTGLSEVSFEIPAAGLIRSYYYFIAKRLYMVCTVH